MPTSRAATISVRRDHSPWVPSRARFVAKGSITESARTYKEFAFSSAASNGPPVAVNVAHHPPRLDREGRSTMPNIATTQIATALPQELETSAVARAVVRAPDRPWQLSSPGCSRRCLWAAGAGSHRPELNILHARSLSGELRHDYSSTDALYQLQRGHLVPMSKSEWRHGGVPST
jgi:hypothetical protein